MTAPTGSPVRVVIIEPALAERSHLVAALEVEADVVVVGQAVGARDGVAMVDKLHPDVVLLGLGIRDGGGLQAIEQIMAHSPTPMLALSTGSAAARSIEATEALAAGAAAVVARPSPWTGEDDRDLRGRVRSLRGVTVLRHPRGRRPSAVPRPAPSAQPGGSRRRTAGRVVAIAASTGGPPALAELLSGLGGLRASVLVVQHIHPDFVAGLLGWMQRVAPLPVRLASDGEDLEPGVVYLGPGDLHLKVGPARTVVLDPEPAGVHRPSADQLFGSVAEHLGPAGIGVLLTGMGQDGAAGLLALRKRGGLTIAQDRASSAVFGMPGAADALGAVERLMPLGEIAAALIAAGREDQP